MLNFAQRINEVILLIKQSVFKLSNHGFLLVEHLIALSITALLVLLITQLLPLINFYQADLNQVTQQEISVLRTQLQKEAKRANHFSNTSSQFQIHLANGTVPTYYISNHRLMRQVGGKGGEVALYHCDKLTTTLHHDQSVTLTLHSSNGNQYTIYLSSSLFPLQLTESYETASEELNEENLNDTIQDELDEAQLIEIFQEGLDEE